MHFFLVTKIPTCNITEAIFSFPKCHSLQGNNFLSFGLAKTPYGCDRLFSQRKLPCDSYSLSPLEVGPGSLKQVLLQLIHVRQTHEAPPTLRLDFQGLFPLEVWNCFSFAASKNTTQLRCCFQVSSLEVALFFHSGFKAGLVICKYSLNYSSVDKQHILEFFSER